MTKLKREIALVYRSGGVYDGEDVDQLVRQCRRFIPGVPITVLTDRPSECACADRVIRFHYDYPGWWSKMELFNPDFDGDWLFFDLDTILVAHAALLAQVRGPAIMQDVYRPGGLQSSVMAIPQAVKQQVWERWKPFDRRLMNQFESGGDQAFLETMPGIAWRHWQKILPGALVSWKVHVKPTGRVPDGAVAVVFHGQPKPRDFGWKL